MIYTNAQYRIDDSGFTIGIKCEINGLSSFVPKNQDNRDYAEILRQVEAGTLTIEDAD
jgi:hypothetical protein